jgi:predicted metal-dependent hydrolase
MSKTQLPNIGDFPCSVRKSKRAKHLQLKVSTRGVEIILPYRCAFIEANRLLEDKKEWLTTALAKIKPAPPIAPPASLYLGALEEFWTLDYEHSEKAARLIEKPDQNLLIKGEFEKNQNWQTLLRKWLKKKASVCLPPLLESLSIKTGLNFKEVSIRGQKTRWGSCSSQKNINLNFQILFLSKGAAKHILLHELCHTVHMNHSRSFWKLLRELDPKTLEYERQLKQPRLFVPDWV